MLAGAALVAIPGAVVAQTAKEHVGTWGLVTTDTVRPDGSRAPTFGGKATGILIFGSDGRFIYLFGREELPKFDPITARWELPRRTRQS